MTISNIKALSKLINQDIWWSEYLGSETLYSPAIWSTNCVLWIYEDRISFENNKS